MPKRKARRFKHAFGIIDPDYARVFTQARIIGWQYGFSVVMHGSFTRDLDLLIVPWEDRAYNGVVEQVMRMIAEACDLRIGKKADGSFDWTNKPHGRRACSMYFKGFSDRRWVDFSVMSCVPKYRDGNLEYDSWVPEQLTMLVAENGKTETIKFTPTGRPDLYAKHQMLVTAANSPLVHQLRAEDKF